MATRIQVRICSNATWKNLTGTNILFLEQGGLSHIFACFHPVVGLDLVHQDPHETDGKGP